MIIAQISDLHARPPGRAANGGTVDTNAMLQRAVQAILDLQPRPDCVVVTGDLTDCGLDAEYDVVDAALAALPMPSFVIPGNHDRHDALVRVLGPRHPYLPRDGFLQYAIDRFPVRLVALDSVIPGETHGTLCPERLAWLNARLAEGDGRPTVVLVHHPAFTTGIQEMDAIGCRDDGSFAATVARHPEIERVLSGHHHRPITARWGGTIAYAAPSTAHQVALDLRPGAPTRFIFEPPGIAVHVWSRAAGVVTHLVPIGDFGPRFDVALDQDYPGGSLHG